MTKWLLDTNILSELRRPQPEPKVLAFIATQPLDGLYVSTVTFAEIRFGIELVADAGRRAELGDWLAQKVRPLFEQRVVPISENVMFKWRLLRRRPQERPYLLSARFDHCSHRAASRPHGRVARHKRVSARPRSGPESLGLSASGLLTPFHVVTPPPASSATSPPAPAC